MTSILRLKTLGASAITLDLLGKVSEDWTPSRGINLQPVQESMPFIIKGTETEIKTFLDTLDDLLYKAEEFVRDKLTWDPVVLEFSSVSGSVQQSLVFYGEVSTNYAPGGSPFLDEDAVYGTLTVTRHGMWKANTQTQVTDSALTAYGDMTGIITVSGRFPALIPLTEVTPNAATIFDKLWIGVRKKRWGWTGFTPVFEAELGSSFSADTTIQADAGASGGQYYRTTFATTTALAKRFTLKIEGIGVSAANSQNFAGRYLILARVRVAQTTTSKVGIQLRTGYENSAEADLSWNYEVEASSSDWKILPLAEVQIPPHSAAQGISTRLNKFTFYIYAERLLGDANTHLWFDGWVLMPVDALFIVRNGSLSTAYSNVIKAVFREDQLPFAVQQDSFGNFDHSLDATLDNWYLPPGECKIVFVGDGPAGSSLTNSVALNMYYLPQWYMYR